MTDQFFAVDEDVKNDLMESLPGARIVSLSIMDSLGGEEWWITLDDGRVIHMESMEWINVNVVTK